MGHNDVQDIYNSVRGRHNGIGRITVYKVQKAKMSFLMLYLTPHLPLTASNFFLITNSKWSSFLIMFEKNNPYSKLSPEKPKNSYMEYDEKTFIN